MKFKHFAMSGLLLSAATLSFSSCSSEMESSIIEEPTVPVVKKGHSLTVKASIGTPQTRVGITESATGLKLNWEQSDKLYLQTSTDNGANWTDNFFTFSVTKINEDGSATFTCADFEFPENTNAVRYVYTSKEVTAATDLSKDAQNLREQSGSLADVAKMIHMQTDKIACDSEESLKSVNATLIHSNAVMKVTINAGDVAWGDNNYAPAEISLKLKSTSLNLLGTENNTVTLKNPGNWTDGKIVANVVVCMDGTVTNGDRWIFETRDGLENRLVQATKSAKALEGGKRYNAPINFTTEDYFPFIGGYFNPNIFESGSLVESDKKFATGNTGCAGWTNWDNADYEKFNYNLRNYKYLVVEFGEGSQHIATGTCLNIFEGDNYWTSCYSNPVNDTNILNVDLSTEAAKDGDGNAKDMSNVGIIGFWSMGPADGVSRYIVIKRMYLSQNPGEGAGADTPSEGDPTVNAPDIVDTDESAF